MCKESHNGMRVEYTDEDYVIAKYDFAALKKRDEDAIARAMADERKRNATNGNDRSGHQG